MQIRVRRDMLEPDCVSIVDGAPIVSVTVVAVLWFDLPPVVVIAAIEARHLLLFRTLGVVELVRVQPVSSCEVCAWGRVSSMTTRVVRNDNVSLYGKRMAVPGTVADNAFARVSL
jgi:hypothetical protein